MAIVGLNPCVFGLNYHDPSVAIVQDGWVIAAAEEEKIQGRKPMHQHFPHKSLEYCLKAAGTDAQSVDTFVIPYQPRLWQARLPLEIQQRQSKLNRLVNDCDSISWEALIEEQGQTWGRLHQTADLMAKPEQLALRLRALIGQKSQASLQFIDHHLAHAAAAYHPSTFDECLVVVIDGLGEYHSGAIYAARQGRFELLDSLQFPVSLGYFYASMTSFVGFRPWEGEGKLMGLAPYGEQGPDHQKISEFFDAIQTLDDLAPFVEKTLNGSLVFDETRSNQFLEQILGLEARKKDTPLRDLDRHLAWLTQLKLETLVAETLQKVVRATGIKRIACAGGVFLNCKMNGFLRERLDDVDFHFSPIAGDFGLSIGAALYSAGHYKGGLDHLLLGPQYADGNIVALLEERGLDYEIIDDPSPVAELLAQFGIGVYFDGGLEFGPRALGGRSIVAHPKARATADFINAQIKMRELWRPFACSILAEYAPEVLEDYRNRPCSRFMIETYRIRDIWLPHSQAVQHIEDHTTRPQIVDAACLPNYHRLISAFRELSGIPLLLNTSLNGPGQPIICNPEDALAFYQNTPLDFILFNSRILVRKPRFQ